MDRGISTAACGAPVDLPALFMREPLHAYRRCDFRRGFFFLAESTPAKRNFTAALADAGVQVCSAPIPEAADSATPLRYEFDGVADELRAAALWARDRWKPHLTRALALYF